MSRKRRAIYRDLADHLSWNGSTYVYQRPTDGRRFSLGSHKGNANAAAKELNRRLQPEVARLVDRALGGNSKTIGEMLDRFDRDDLSKRRLSDRTLYDYRHKLSVIRAEWGGRAARSLQPVELSTFLDRFPARQSQRYKGLLSQFCRFCYGKGQMDSDLAAPLRTQPYKRQRQPLTLDTFYAVREAADELERCWFNLALHSLQREADLALLRFDAVVDGILSVLQQKTGVLVNIAIAGPLELSIAACRDDVLSPFIIHRAHVRRVRTKWREHPTQVHPRELGRAWAAARDKAGIQNDLPARQRSAFHDIRGLGARLLKKQGVDPQTLLGHLDEKTTEIYLDDGKPPCIEAVGGIPGVE